MHPDVCAQREVLHVSRTRRRTLQTAGDALEGAGEGAGEGEEGELC